MDSLGLQRSSGVAISLLACCAAVSAQADWTQLTPTTLPPVRSDHVLVADNVSLYMFGGRPQPGNYVANDTWRYLGTTWLQLTTATAPSGRWQARADYDSARGRIVLFGGRAPSNVFFDDTWELTGASWTQVMTNTVPPKRERHGFAYDAARKQIVMFGGRGVGNVLLADTWTYDGKDWSQVTTATAPSARWHPFMCYDSDRRVVVLFGGAAGAAISAAQNDTWEWDGSRWTKMNPATSPPPTGVTSMIYDAYRKRIVLFAGLNASNVFLNTTWEYDGKTWLLRTPNTSPGVRSGAQLAYHDVQKAVFTYGGFETTAKQLGDFWKYETDKPATFTTSGTACKGSAGTPALTATEIAWTGDALTLRVAPVPAASPVLIALGFSKTSWGALPLPLPLGGLGAPGCTLYTGLELILLAPNTGGVATAAIPIPNDIRFAGANLFNQALVVDSVNQLGFVFSDLGESKIGVR